MVLGLIGGSARAVVTTNHPAAIGDGGLGRRSWSFGLAVFPAGSRVSLLCDACLVQSATGGSPGAGDGTMEGDGGLDGKEPHSGAGSSAHVGWGHSQGRAKPRCPIRGNGGAVAVEARRRKRKADGSTSSADQKHENFGGSHRGGGRLQELKNREFFEVGVAPVFASAKGGGPGVGSRIFIYPMENWVSLCATPRPLGLRSLPASSL